MNLIKKIVYSLYYRIGKLIGFHQNEKNKEVAQVQARKRKRIKYKIGNVHYHNSVVDGLIPQLVEIGDDFVSAPGSIILAHDASPYLHVKRHRVEKTVIGNKVFLGTKAVILPGVTIGDGVIVGAGAIVTKSIPPYVVVAGNPAKIMCTVDEYMDKLEKKGVLFDTPKSFDDIFEGKSYTQKHLDEFQKKYLKEKGLNKL